VDVAVAGGRIAAIGPSQGAARETVHSGGDLLTPGLVEAHLHLDKALLDDRIPTTAGTRDEPIRPTREAKREFTPEDIAARARRVLDLVVAAGTTAIRAHVEVEAVVGLMGMEAMLRLRHEFAPAVELQLCALAQEGIVQASWTEGRLRRALTMGADLVGGCPYNDTDGLRQIEIVFARAREFGVDVDFHVDFADAPDHLHVLEIMRQTISARWQGRVAVGHLTELAALDPAEQQAVVARLAEARVGLISLPATDLYLTGRSDEKNVRDPFIPVGTADLAHMAFLGAVRGTWARRRCFASSLPA